MTSQIWDLGYFACACRRGLDSLRHEPDCWVGLGSYRAAGVSAVLMIDADNFRSAKRALEVNGLWPDLCFDIVEALRPAPVGGIYAPLRDHHAAGG